MNEYELIRVLGKGAYGVAHLAKHKPTGQLWCIKIIGMTGMESDKAAVKEAALLSKLNSPNVIGYRDSFFEKKQLHIVTEFCENGDLFTEIRGRKASGQMYTEDEVMETFVMVASGLHHIHASKILHRDLKTQNIFIGRGGIIKLGDLGISRVLEGTYEMANTVTGTPYYMAPEVCTSQPYTFKSDMWSLGCVLYELCTLQHAFAADSILSLVFQIVNGSFPPIAPHYSPGLVALVNALLDKNPNNRPNFKQLWTIPFVASHLQRVRHQAGHSTLMRSIKTGRPEGQAAAAPGSLAEARTREVMSPSQAAKQRKQQESDQRQLELQVGALALQRDRSIAAVRKTQQLTGSLAGANMQQGQPTARVHTADAHRRNASVQAANLAHYHHDHGHAESMGDTVLYGTLDQGPGRDAGQGARPYTGHSAQSGHRPPSGYSPDHRPHDAPGEPQYSRQFSGQPLPGPRYDMPSDRPASAAYGRGADPNYPNNNNPYSPNAMREPPGYAGADSNGAYSPTSMLRGPGANYADPGSNYADPGGSPASVHHQSRNHSAGGFGDPAYGQCAYDLAGQHTMGDSMVNLGTMSEAPLNSTHRRAAGPPSNYNSPLGSRAHSAHLPLAPGHPSQAHSNPYSPDYSPNYPPSGPEQWPSPHAAAAHSQHPFSDPRCGTPSHQVNSNGHWEDNGTHFGRPGTGMGGQDTTCGSTVLMASCVPPAQSGAGDPEQWHRAAPPSGYGGAGAPGNQSVMYDALGNAHGGETLGATVLMGSVNVACVGGRMGPPPLDQYGSRSGSSRPVSGSAGGPRDMDLALGTPPRPVRVAEACTPRPYGPGPSTPSSTRSQAVEVNGYSFGMNTAARDSLSQEVALQRAATPRAALANGHSFALPQSPLAPSNGTAAGPAPVVDAHAAAESDGDESFTDYTDDDYEESTEDDDSEDNDGRAQLQSSLLVAKNLRHIQHEVRHADGSESQPGMADAAPAPSARSQRLRANLEKCQAWLGRDFASTHHLLTHAYTSMQADVHVDRAALNEQLLSMIALPPSEAKAALFLLEQVVFSEVYQA